MEYLILIIPVIIAIVLAIKFIEQTVWWEYGLLLIPSIFIVFILKFSFESYDILMNGMNGFIKDVQGKYLFTLKVLKYQLRNLQIHVIVGL